MCIGRGGVVTAQRRRSTTTGWGRIFVCRSSAHTTPFCVAITTATFPESRFVHACFFCVMLWVRAAAGGLRCVRGRQAKAKGHDARRGVCVIRHAHAVSHVPSDTRQESTAPRLRFSCDLAVTRPPVKVAFANIHLIPQFRCSSRTTRKRTKNKNAKTTTKAVWVGRNRLH